MQRYHVFISYSRRDRVIMEQVRDHLTGMGLRVWTDENLTPGTEVWTHAIEHAIEQSDSVVVLLSPDSKGSQWVARELNYAATQGVRIFPLLVRGSPRDAIPLMLSNTQWSDVRGDFATGIAHLLNALYSHLGLTPPAVLRDDVPLVPARRPSNMVGILLGLAVTLLVGGAFIVLFLLPRLLTTEPQDAPPPSPTIQTRFATRPALSVTEAASIPTPTTLPVLGPPTVVSGERVLGPACEPLVEDEFTGGQTPNDWFVGDGFASTIRIVDDFYRIILEDNAQPNAASWGSLRGWEPVEARIEAVITAEKFGTPASRTGLWLRYIDENNFLAFMIASTGFYRIARFENGYSDLIDWTETRAIRRGANATNTLRIDADGDTYTLYINGQQVDTVTVPGLPVGRIAFWGSTNEPPNAFYLDYLRICPL
jgi:hypothetical protein